MRQRLDDRHLARELNRLKYPETPTRSDRPQAWGRSRRGDVGASCDRRDADARAQDVKQDVEGWHELAMICLSLEKRARSAKKKGV